MEPVFRHLAKSTFNEFKTCSPEDIYRIFHQFPIKSCQLDPIPANVFSRISDDLIPFIVNLCNRSFDEGILPNTQKLACVTPLLKKSGLDPSIPGNYRPVSNLTFLSKVLERVVVGQLSDYLTSNNLLPSVQSAYRSLHSTETAMLRIISDVYDAVNSSKVTLLALLDLSAAFDCVDHEILVNRLSGTFGINGLVLSWLVSFLSNRTQYVAFNGSVSTTTNLECGVPQGSVLGPLLFVLYTADIVEIAASFGVSVHCYADDIQLYVHCDVASVDEAINRILNCIAAIDLWMSSNRLKLNPDKTQFLWLGTWQQLKKFNQPDLHMPSGLVIKTSSVARDLGVLLDSHLSMDAHIDKLVKTSINQLRQLRAIRRSLSTEAAKVLIHSFITSRLDYCNSLLFGISDKAIRKLQLIQNSAARLISCRQYRDHITPVLRELHWLPIRQRIVYKIALFVHKCLKGSAPNYLCEMLIPTEMLPSHQRLRSAAHHELHLANPVLLWLGSRSFRCSGPSVLNSLPNNLRDPLISTDCFKTLLKTHLFNIAYST